MLKDTGPQRLLAAVAAVAEGDTLFAPSVTRRLVEAYAPRAERPAAPAGTLDQLTGRELDVLRLVAGGLSDPGIAQALVISESTVKTHLNRTMAELGIGSRAQAVVLAYETGLVVPGGGGPREPGGQRPRSGRRTARRAVRRSFCCAASGRPGANRVHTTEWYPAVVGAVPAPRPAPVGTVPAPRVRLHTVSR